MNGLGSKYVRK